MPIWDANNLSAPHTQRELAQIAEASASVFSRSNEQIDTLRDELAAEKAKSGRLVKALAAIGDLESVSAAEFKARHPKLNAALDEVGREQWFVQLSWFAHDAIAAYEVQP